MVFNHYRMKIVNYFRMLRAMNTSPAFQLGDVVNGLGRFADIVECRAVIRKKFVHRNEYRDIVNTYIYFVDGVNGYFFQSQLQLAPIEVEQEMWLSNE